MRRRELLAAMIGSAAIARPVLAADPARTVRIGVLAPAPLRPIDSLKQRLHERGWIEGQNVQFEFRWAGSDDTRYPALAAELANVGFFHSPHRLVDVVPVVGNLLQRSRRRERSAFKSNDHPV